MRKLSIKERVYPAVLNHHGDVFGGWIVSKMDMACGIAVEEIVLSKAVTVSISKVNFLKPISNGNIVLVYTQITSIGRSSITIKVDVDVINNITNEEYTVTSAEFVFVCVDKAGKSVPVKDVLKNGTDQNIKDMVNQS